MTPGSLERDAKIAARFYSRVSPAHSILYPQGWDKATYLPPNLPGALRAIAQKLGIDILTVCRAARTPDACSAAGCCSPPQLLGRRRHAVELDGLGVDGGRACVEHAGRWGCCGRGRVLECRGAGHGGYGIVCHGLQRGMEEGFVCLVIVGRWVGKPPVCRCLAGLGVVIYNSFHKKVSPGISKVAQPRAEDFTCVAAERCPALPCLCPWCSLVRNVQLPGSGDLACEKWGAGCTYVGSARAERWRCGTDAGCVSSV
jgi:hypothetical protein